MNDAGFDLLLNYTLASAVEEWRHVIDDNYIDKWTKKGTAWGGNDKRLLKAALDEKFIRSMRLDDEADACSPDGNLIADKIRDELKNTKLMSDRVVELRKGWFLIRTPKKSIIKANITARADRKDEYKLLIDFYEKHLEEVEEVATDE